MSSLFNDGDCGCRSNSAEDRKKCKGCACEVLRHLANEKPWDFCHRGQPQRVLIVTKGSHKPLFLGGSTQPTEFTVEDFDPKNCCVSLSFEVPYLPTDGAEAVPCPPRQRKSFIIDCRSIAGVSCIEG